MDSVAKDADHDNEATGTEVAKGDEQVEELVTKQNTSVPVWKHFGFKQSRRASHRNLTAPHYCICLQEVGAKDRNTSILYSHLKDKHPELYADVCKIKPQVKR